MAAEGTSQTEEGHRGQSAPDPELEQLINQARLTTTAQFYYKDKKAGLTEICPTGPPANEARPRPQKIERPKI